MGVDPRGTKRMNACRNSNRDHSKGDTNPEIARETRPNDDGGSGNGRSGSRHWE